MQYRHRISAIKRVGDYLLARSVSPAELLRRLGLPSTLLLHEDVWLSRRHSLLLGDSIGTTLGDPLAGLHVAQLIKFTDYGSWGEGILRSGSVVDAIGFAATNVHRIETGTRINLVREPRQVRLQISFEGPLGANPRQHVEANLLTMRKLLDLAVERVPALARLPHVAHPHADLEPILGADLEFSCPTAELVFDPDALALPLNSPPDSELRRYRLLGGRSSIHDTARGVLRVLRESLGDDRPSAAAVAQRLDMNLRTMQRHLAAWGVTFEDILDQYRCRAALDHLRSGRHSITDIAFQLGYSDSAHFTRAFRRWTGLAPTQALDALAVRPIDSTPLHWEAEPLRVSA